MKKFFALNKITIFVTLGLIGWSLLTISQARINTSFENYDAITVYFYVMANFSIRLLHITAPIFVMIVACNNFHSLLHSGSIKNHLTRLNYKKIININILKSLSKMWLLPTIAAILFLGMIFITKNFNFENAIPKIIDTSITGEPVLSGTISNIKPVLYETPVKFMVIYFIVIFLHSIMYINIGLVMCKRNSNFLVAMISSFLIFIGIAIISEIGIGSIFSIGLDLPSIANYFNMVGIWVYADISNLNIVLIIAIIYAALSFIPLYLTYKNSENVVMASER